MRIVVPTVFSCVASQNKRGRRAFDETIGDLEPGLEHAFLFRFCGSRGPRGSASRNCTDSFTALSVGFGLRAPGVGLRDRRLRPARPKGPQKHSLFVLGALFPKFAASGECNEPRRVAVRRVGWRRTARLKEPLKHGQQLGPARRENRNRFSRPKNKQSPKHSPVLRLVSAPLRLRCRSAGAARHLKDGPVYF